MISPNESLNDNFIRLLKERILERIDADKIVIFGSRARGDNKYNSDIDIAIFTNDDLSAVKSDLEDSINTLLKFNIVNYYDLPDTMKIEIDKDGIIIYEKIRADNKRL